MDKKGNLGRFVLNWAYKPLAFICVVLCAVFLLAALMTGSVLGIIISIVLFTIASFFYYMYRIKKNIHWVGVHHQRW